ncbi:MAG: DUF2141 domain-containing protein [Bryobacteraceae bacterium]|nr:DUF2141 domain-containing protein [Bryobacteraceae bacterium]
MNLRTLTLHVASAAVLSAGELTVVVTGGDPSGKGEVGCALYRSPDGFPMIPAKAASTVWLKEAAQVECRFKGIPPGPFAVAVSVDRNGNRKTDKNLFGIPTEPWGVSNNARPSLRAPRFDEASGQMPEGDLRIEVKVAK